VPGTALALSYGQLPVGVPERVLPFLGIDPDPVRHGVMAAARSDAKRPGETWPPAETHDVPAGLRIVADRWVGAAYRRLEGAAEQRIRPRVLTA
jgi:hypothetical protein